MCKYVHLSVYVYVYMYICVYVYMYMYICLLQWAHVDLSIYLIYLYACRYACVTYACIHPFIHPSVHASIHSSILPSILPLPQAVPPLPSIAPPIHYAVTEDWLGKPVCLQLWRAHPQAQNAVRWCASRISAGLTCRCKPWNPAKSLNPCKDNFGLQRLSEAQATCSSVARYLQWSVYGGRIPFHLSNRTRTMCLPWSVREWAPKPTTCLKCWCLCFDLTCVEQFWKCFTSTTSPGLSECERRNSVQELQPVSPSGPDPQHEDRSKLGARQSRGVVLGLGGLQGPNP